MQINNKKAQGGLMIFSPARLVLLVVIFFTLIYIININKAQAYSIPENLREEILVKRFVSDPDCLAYKDPYSGREVAGVIDFSKFTQENLDNCYYVEEDSRTIAFRMYLKYLDGTEEQQLMFKTKNYKTEKSDRIIIKKTKMMKDNEIMEAELVFHIKNV